MRKHILLIGLLFIAANTYSQTVPSPTENYVYTKTYLSKPGDPVQKPVSETIQYFDGLGRPKQILNVKASPLGKDIVTPIIYDEFGRQKKDYLPMPQSGSSNGAIYQQNPQSDPPVSNPVYPILHPYETTFYSKKVLENSPLDRIRQQVQVGTAWSGKPVVFDYETNTGTEVKKFVTATTWPNNATSSVLTQSGNYGAAQLYKNILTDEDLNTTTEFKNGEGQTLLVRKNDGTKDSDTYYVYNEYNQLAFVISPEAAAKTVISQTDLDDLCYQYRYDGKNRLVEKKLPGKGWEYMVYDKTDRLIMSQDANLASRGKWLITKYDKFGRVICTGFHPFGSRVDAQNLIKDMTIVEERNGTGYSQNGLQIYYDRVYFYDMESYLSVNYYDSYPSGTVFPTGDAILGVPILKDTFPQGVTQSTKSLPTASFVKNIEDDKWTKSYIFYDRKARPIASYSYNHLGGFTKTESVLDFTGVPQKTMTYHTRSNPNVITATVEENFTYDNQNRLTAHTHKVNANAPVTLARNKYNEIGQLTEKEVGGDQNGNSPLQTVNYAYNIRGWMTGINSGDILYNPSNGSYLLTGGKLFGYNIRYNDPQNASLGAARYNGNIAEVDWISKDVSLKRYGYQYDGLNRLLRGNYQDPGNALPASHINDETLTYDLNGNIKTLIRNSKHAKQYTPIVIDNLGYYYNGNRVTNITDASGNSSGYEGGGQPIQYDLNGNMIAMPDKGISAIAYNFLNLPTQITQSPNTTKYDYRADGVKIKKQYTLVNASGTSYIETEYLDGFQYSTPNTEPIRKALENPDDATLSAVTAGEEEAFSSLEGRELVSKPGDPQNLAPVLSFFPTTEGYYDFENFRYIYQYKDHLGNVRLSYVKNSAGVPQVMDSNDYYPFGMSFLKPFGQSSVYDPMAIPYNYKYNGKELQETGMYDYGARFYMPDIGRFGQYDPLAEITFQPYAYANNNPIFFNDPTGMVGEGANDDMQTGVDGDTSLAFGVRASDVQKVSGMGGMNSYNYGDSTGTKAGSKKNEKSDTNSLHQQGVAALGDYSLDEEPVNFFGKNDGYSYNKKFQDSYSKFKNTAGDGIFRAYGHGFAGYLWDGENSIYNASTFDKVMAGKNANWSNIDKMNDPVLILYFCYSAARPVDGKSIAQVISAAHPNLTVVGFRNEIIYNTPGDRLTKVTKHGGIGGDIVFFRNGNQLAAYQYNQFLGKYKNFQ